jgi:hypothetical protein
MGLFDNLFRGNGNGSGSTDITLYSAGPAALAPTVEGVYSPDHSGDIPGTNVRTIPIFGGVPRGGWTPEEAEMMADLAERRTRYAQASKKVLESAEKVERADLVEQTAFRRYQSTVAEVELGKLEENASYLEKLHVLNPRYAELKGRYGRSERFSKIATQTTNQWLSLLSGR